MCWMLPQPPALCPSREFPLNSTPAGKSPSQMILQEKKKSRMAALGMDWNCQRYVGITKAAMGDFREQEMEMAWEHRESQECHRLSKVTRYSSCSQARSCAGRDSLPALPAALGVVWDQPRECPSPSPPCPEVKSLPELELPWGLAQPRAQFPSHGDFWGQGGHLAAGSRENGNVGRAGCARQGTVKGIGMLASGTGEFGGTGKGSAEESAWEEALEWAGQSGNTWENGWERDCQENQLRWEQHETTWRGGERTRDWTGTGTKGIPVGSFPGLPDFPLDVFVQGEGILRVTQSGKWDFIHTIPWISIPLFHGCTGETSCCLRCNIPWKIPGSSGFTSPSPTAVQTWTPT